MSKQYKEVRLWQGWSRSVGPPQYLVLVPGAKLLANSSHFQHTNTNIHDESRSENQFPRYLTLGHIQTWRPVRVRWSADILKMRSIFTQLTFKRRLPKICQYNRIMLYLPTIRSQMVTDQNLTGLKGIRKRPPLDQNYLIKYLQGGRWRPLQEPLERLLAAAPVSIGLTTYCNSLMFISRMTSTTNTPSAIAREGGGGSQSPTPTLV